ncbi:MAG: hypothetical protein O3C51_16800 [Planctomycetota bacterium]|nr:hypothetical protein [Planctomycetota bacterium]
MHWVQFRFTRAAVAALAVVAPTADHVPTDPGPGRLQLPAPRVVVEVEPRARAASPRPLILALGQSNLDAAFCDLDPSRVQEGSGKQQRRIWNPFSGSWEPLDPWRKNNATRFLLGPGLPGIPSQRLVGRPKACPMLRFMSLLQAEEPLRGSSTTYLVKACATGTYMFDWTGEQNLEWVSWNHLPAVPVIGRHLYPTLLYDLATAKSASREPLRVEAVVLVLGETDSLTHVFLQGGAASAVSRSWGRGFLRLYTRLQADLLALGLNDLGTDVPWIIGRTHAELPDYGDPPVGAPGPYSFHYLQTVRAEQERAAADPTLNVHLVDLDGLEHVADTTPGVHFDARSLDEVGERLYSKFKEVRR